MTGAPHAPGADLGAWVRAHAAAGDLVVQPRMGMSDPVAMADGVRAVATAAVPTVATVTLDSYTRVGDHAAAERTLAAGGQLNGYPIVVHGAERTAWVAAAAGPQVPVQVRHGSADPGAIFRTMAAAGLSASEGGPVSYCLPYGRTPLADSVDAWRRATIGLVDDCADRGRRAHLETFGGCLLGQLCPPSMLVAMSVLESIFFTRLGVRSVSLSYAQQTSPVQDVEALTALRQLAGEFLPSHVDWHLVLYTYMGVYPRSPGGARNLLEFSADIAVRGRAERLIVKTTAEAHRIPTVEENLAALLTAGRRAHRARSASYLPWHHQVDHGSTLAEARAMIEAVLGLSPDLGEALLLAFRRGVLDVPFCLHVDNQGLTQAAVGADGRLRWIRTGNLPLPGPARTLDRRVSSTNLLGMLRFTATQQDRLATRDRPRPARLAATTTASTNTVEPGRIALVGCGPRGLAILERLGARLRDRPSGHPVDIYAIDAVEVGCGRIWRTDQPDHLLMNTPAGEVTMFSGAADGDGDRAGAGPSLAQWWQRVDPPRADPLGYAPRAVYGRYLRFVLDVVEAGLPAGVRLHRITREVVDLKAHQAGDWRLAVAGDPADPHDIGTVIAADRVVLTTGHPLPVLRPEQRELAAFATARPELRYIRGNSAADMPLSDIPGRARVGVIGLGLSFFDVLSCLTTGRGGQFQPIGDGGLRYLPSGAEPIVIAGSRGGLPLQARGRNQKPAAYAYQPGLFTHDRVRLARARRRLDFNRDVLPWLVAEVELVCLSTAARLRFGPDVAEALRRATIADVAAGADARVVLARHRRRLGLFELPPVDLYAWARPFAGRRFASQADFDVALMAELHTDIAHAEEGNVDGPRKAATDTLRDVRSVIRHAVDYSGLTPRSHREDFLGAFVPMAAVLSTGPPAERLRQLVALVNAGVLRVMGPGARFGTDPATGAFVVDSQTVAGAPASLDVLVDARIPSPDVRADPSPLMCGLHRDGTVSSYVNGDGGGGGGAESFDTGGIAVTPAPYHPIGRDASVGASLYVLGIPTEHTRWFTQVGSGRPGAWGEFTADADAVAGHLLSTDTAQVRREFSSIAMAL